MDKYEKRRAALKGLVDSLGRGGIATVAARIGKEPNYVSRMLYPPGKQGRKRIGEDSMDALASEYPEWFAELPRDVPYEKGEPSPPKKAEEPQNPPSGGSLVDRYDAASEATRAAIDLILLPQSERTTLKASLLLAITALEEGAKEALHERKKTKNAA